MRDTSFGPVDVLDAHTHFFSRFFFESLAKQSPDLADAPDAIARIGDVTGWSMPPENPTTLADTWVAELDRAGVDAALVIASIPGDEDSVGAAVAAHPTRLLGAFMLDPTRPDTCDRIPHAFDDLRLRVACLFPAMHRYSVAECEGARTVASAAADRPGTAVFVHCGALSVGVRKKLGLPSRFDMRMSNPLDLHPLAAEFSSTKFVVPHFGAGLFREALMLADLCPNVYLDTSSSNAWTRYEPMPLSLADVFRRALDVVGPERLLFGTDSSFFPRGWHAEVFERQAGAIAEAGADADAARAIFGGNFKRLLGA